MAKAKSKCRHNGTWLMAAGYEWCYECGAFRQLVSTGPLTMAVASPWCRPAGIGKPNPWSLWDARRESYKRRKAAKP